MTSSLCSESDPASILSQVRDLDRIPKYQRGPLYGMAIEVKDVMDTKDMPTQNGSPIYQGYQPSSDSSAVAVLRAAGALIFGSSVACDFFPFNWADLAATGSSREFAAPTGGIFAMKLTFNAISTEGQKSVTPTFDTIGFFARSVEDLQLLADLFAIQDNETPQDIHFRKVSVALMKIPIWSLAGLGTVSAMKETATTLRYRGIKVKEASFPPKVANVEALKQIQKPITLAEAQPSFLIGDYWLDKTKLATKIREIVENTSNCTRTERMEALDRYSDMRHIINELAANYTAIIAPSAVDEAPMGLRYMGCACFNTMWTANQGFHMPVVNVPTFIGVYGMPVGLALVGPRFHDQRLLQICKALSKVLVTNGGSNVRN
ncbi:amidase signature domain-containing protein [Ilyonectria robusta]|uniref:amidase signature domain-containing protein n=1 Tax=Ilyonectria robusta TaxID=1079257 RepID=UPI001E8EA08C|nr:amidase signature domain-containing protein [Ilyonectria robusta]KAH8647007.1 amidase signature domain-containing protein [Ilyonectria robusta]